MIPRSFLLVAAVAVTFAPSSLAQTCSTGVEDLCQVSEDSGFAQVFGDYGDLVLIGLALVLLALVLVLLLSLLRRLHPTRLLKFEVAEKVRELEPGSSARFKLELENLNRTFPVDVFLERPDVPTGWSHEVLASILLPSGFRVPQALAQTGSFPLSSETRGANRAHIEVRLKSPPEITVEETLDYELRAVPVFRGKLRKRRAKRARLTALVTPHLPLVQITKVTHEPERIRAGTPVLTRAYLSNKGERDATSVAVKFSLNGQEVDKKVVPMVTVRSEAQVEFNWVPQAGENKIRVALES